MSLLIALAAVVFMALLAVMVLEVIVGAAVLALAAGAVLLTPCWVLLAYGFCQGFWEGITGD